MRQKRWVGPPPPPSCLSETKYEQMLFRTEPLDADAEGNPEECKSQLDIEEIMYESLNYFCKYKHKIEKKIES